MAEIDHTKLKGAYARLKGLERAVPSTGTTRGALGKSFNEIVEQISKIVGDEDDISSFVLERDAFYSGGSGDLYCHIASLRSKLFQLSEYLEMVYHVGSQIVEVGTLYNAIQHEELKVRVADLLSAPANFDRAINQATLVLEDRIRTKADSGERLIGTRLVNQTIKADPNTTKIKVSDEQSEQEGFANLCRGIVGSFRNPTHHRLTDQFSREDALKVCGFVDVLLVILEKAEVQH